jgi:hypothetical protein
MPSCSVFRGESENATLISVAPFLSELRAVEKSQFFIFSDLQKIAILIF